LKWGGKTLPLIRGDFTLASSVAAWHELAVKKAAEKIPLALITGGHGDLATAVANVLRAGGWQVQAPCRAELDVTHAASVQAFIGTLPHLDLLIHAAGSRQDALMLKMTQPQWDAMQATHLKSAFLCAQASLKKMLEAEPARVRGGQLIFISSFSALSGPVGQANYAAAKAGLLGLSQSIAAEYGPQGVRSNVVLPGFLETRMTSALLADPAQRQRVLAEHTLGRLNTVAESAQFIAQLADFQHISGQCFQLDSRVRSWA
jgi:3-oxoacyl-[acyl-carrier protein] reductase